MSVEVTIEGLDKWLTIVDPVRFTNEMDKAIDRVAGIWRDETKKMPPVSGPRDGYEARGIPVAEKHGGTLRQGIEKRKVALLAAEVFTGGGASGYGVYPHDGTPYVPPRPFFKWMLEDFGGLQMADVVIQS